MYIKGDHPVIFSRASPFLGLICPRDYYVSLYGSYGQTGGPLAIFLIIPPSEASSAPVSDLYLSLGIHM